MPFLKCDETELEIYYEEEGEGETLVMVGGFTATVEVWGRLRPLLSKKYRLIMADNRGSGRTKILNEDEIRSPAKLSMDVLSLVNGLNIKKFHIFGGSMGGMICQEFATKNQERLKSLIIACSQFGGKDAIKPNPGVRETRAKGGVPTATPAERRAALETLFHPNTIDNRPEVVKFYDDNKRKFPHSKEELERRIKGMDECDVSEEIRNLKVPTLVICGSNDVLVPTENSRLITERIAGSELSIIEESGHHFYSEQPEKSSKIILEFLSKH
ncbi:MAG: alpha/beta hydrolase [Nitrospinota bacterium]|nr:alpha/beta hydrolase [Nitrospinota bacterium]